jgi:hypothetical protein
MYSSAPSNFNDTCTDLTRKVLRLAASRVLFPCSHRVASFQLTTLLSLPHTGGSTLPRGKHGLELSGYTPASSSLHVCPLLFSNTSTNCPSSGRPFVQLSAHSSPTDLHEHHSQTTTHCSQWHSSSFSQASPSSIRSPLSRESRLAS